MAGGWTIRRDEVQRARSQPHSLPQNRCAWGKKPDPEGYTPCGAISVTSTRG